MNERRIGEIYRSLLEMNRDAFADGEYEIACKVLPVALCCGQTLRNAEHLREVGSLAEKQSRYLDDHHPESIYSNKAANARGNVGPFQMAAQKANKLMHSLMQTNRNGPDVQLSLLKKAPGLQKTGVATEETSPLAESTSACSSEPISKLNSPIS